MIDPQVFLVEITKVFKHFGREINPEFLPDIEEILSEDLTTEEFIQACKNTTRRLQPHPSYFPSLQWMIDSVLGTLEERAANELKNPDRFSIIGRQAFNGVGGAWVFSRTERPEMFKKDFISTYLALAKTAKPIPPSNVCPNGMTVAEQLKMQEPAKAIAPSVEQPRPVSPDLTAPPEPLTLANKVSTLNAKLKFPNLRHKAIEEAMALGLGITQDEIFLPPELDGNQLLEDMLIDVTNLLRDFYAGKRISTTEDVEQEIDF